VRHATTAGPQEGKPGECGASERIRTGVAGNVGFSLGFKLKALRRMASVVLATDATRARDRY
jgi:hypothetical protein